MTTEIESKDIFRYLLPSGGYSLTDFDSAIYDDGVIPITKQQFDDAVKNWDSIQTEIKQKEAKATADKAAAKASAQAKLAALGLTPDEVTAIIGA